MICYDNFGIAEIYYNHDVEQLKKLIEEFINDYKEIKITNIHYGKEKNNIENGSDTTRKTKIPTCKK